MTYWIADFVTKHPRAILGITLVLTLAIASEIPNIERNPSPEDMIASFEDYDAIRDRFEEDFGNTDQIALLIVVADDVTSLPVLDYVHELTEHFESADGVRRVESITKTPIQKPPEEEIIDLDSFEEESEEDDLPQDVLDAMLTLTEVAPERFPLGLTDTSALPSTTCPSSSARS